MQPNHQTTKALGIFQGDIIVRTALLKGIEDLRANPYLLDYVFASLAQDSVQGLVASVSTLNDYGEKEASQAKSWFLKTAIPVMVVPRIDDAKVPCITIKLAESSETEVTLGDIHYEPQEDTGDAEWPPISDSFAVVSYDPNSGTVVIPDEIQTEVIFAPGQVLVDRNGGVHPILAVSDSGVVTIAPGPPADFSQTLLKGAKPAMITQLESAVYRETYQIGCHASSEPVYLTWLHSIVIFILLRYKQDLLEARGFERSVANSTDFDRNDNFPEDQNVFSRYINVTGFVRQYWPKRTDPKITAFDPQPIQVIGSGNLPGGIDPNTQLWIGDQDSLSTLKPPLSLPQSARGSGDSLPFSFPWAF